MIFAILIALAAPGFAVSIEEIDTAIADVVSFLLQTVPSPEIGTIGGEWLVFGVARSGLDIPDEFFENYLVNVERELIERDGILHNVRRTDYSRMILALASAGFDPRDVAGFDLTYRISDFERVVWQGINGAIFALLALDSLNHSETQELREQFVGEILRRQLSDGGWNLTAGTVAEISGNEQGDADLTGMALQALAKYRDIPEVVAAIDRGLIFLSENQDDYGGFSGSFSLGGSAVESVVQVAVALGELGIRIDDERFVKNGNTVADNILSFLNSYELTVYNLMSIEQSFYGLVSIRRSLDGRSSLYRMSDIENHVNRREREWNLLRITKLLLLSQSLSQQF